MDITLTSVIGLVTVIVTYLFGLISKKVTWFKDDYIPLQNLTIGIFSSIICYGFKIDNMSLPVALFTCLTSALCAGGIYDLTKTGK